jgi:hypothetical protein
MKNRASSADRVPLPFAAPGGATRNPVRYVLRPREIT